MLMVELELEGRAVGVKLGRTEGLDLVELLPIFQVLRSLETASERLEHLHFSPFLRRFLLVFRPFSR